MTGEYPTTGNVVFESPTNMPGTPMSQIQWYPPEPSPAVVELAETPPEVIRWALGLMTPNELAGALGVKEGTLSVWRSTGDGPPFVKLGKQVFYRLDDLSQWVWSKYPQVKNTHTEAGAAGAEQETQEELPRAPYPSQWVTQTTGL